MSTFFAMLVVLVAMLLTLAAAGLVVCYVAFVSRGRDIPRAGWLTDAMRRAVERWHVPPEPDQHDYSDQHDDPDQPLHVGHGDIRSPSPR